MTKLPDFRVLGNPFGSVVQVVPLSEAARDWVNENVSLEDWQDASAFSCETRFAGDLLEGMRFAGFNIRLGFDSYETGV